MSRKLVYVHTYIHVYICHCLPKGINNNWCEIHTVQLNLNLTFTRVWHTNFWTNFLCHLWVTHEKIIKIYICMRVTLESLNKFIGSLLSCTWSEQIYLATRELQNKFVEPLTSCTRAHDLIVMELFWLVGVVYMSIWYKGNSCEVCKCYDHQSCFWNEFIKISDIRTHEVRYSWGTYVLVWRRFPFSASLVLVPIQRAGCARLHTYYVTCKMHAWLIHLWIVLQLTHCVVYSRCSLLHQPDCCLILAPVLIK